MYKRITDWMDQRLYYRVFARQIDIPAGFAAVSFSFDDFPDSAMQNGARLLEEHGGRGTFYLTPGLCGKVTDVGTIVSMAEARALAAAGHELGNHTYSHLDCNSKAVEDAIADIERAEGELQGTALRNFSYPFGASNIRIRKKLRNRFDCCRGTDGGVNRLGTDLMDLRANAVYTAQDNLGNLLEMIADTARNGGWLILYTHDVCEKPGRFGCTPEEFARLLGAARDSNLQVLTVNEALVKAQAAAA